MAWFEASAHGIGGFTVKGESLNGDITILATSGTQTFRDWFTADDSGIRSSDVLKSYCRSIIAQWEYNRKHNKHNGAPWRGAVPVQF